MMIKDEFDYDITFEESYEYVVVGDDLAGLGTDVKETNSESSD